MGTSEGGEAGPPPRAARPLPALTLARPVTGTFGVMAVLLGAYLVSSRRQLLSPWEPGWSLVDLWVPYLPGAFLVYLTHYALVGAALALLPAIERERLLWRMILAQGAALLFFQLAPAALPPMSPPRGFPLAWLCRWVIAIDSPMNTFPSLHAAFALLSGWSLRSRFPGWGRWAVPWAWAVVASTALAKRHFLADAAGGALLAYASARLIPARLDPAPGPETGTARGG